MLIAPTTNCARTRLLGGVGEQEEEEEAAAAAAAEDEEERWRRRFSVSMGRFAARDWVSMW